MYLISVDWYVCILNYFNVFLILGNFYRISSVFEYVYKLYVVENDFVGR